MHEVQKPKKPLYYYYGVAMLILMCFNLLAMPYMAEKQVKNSAENCTKYRSLKSLSIITTAWLCSY